MFPLLPLTTFNQIKAAETVAAPTGRLLVVADATNYKTGLPQYIKANFGSTEYLVDISSIAQGDAAEQLDAFIKLLDAGTYQLFTSASQANLLIEAGVPGNRLVVVSASEPVKDTAGLQISAQFTAKTYGDLAQTLSKTVISTGGSQQLFVKFGNDATLADLVAAVKVSATPVIDAARLTTEHKDITTGQLPIAPVFTAALATDRPDKLYTSLVVDTNEIALGLVYSSDESIAEAIRTGTGVYQSRKHGLWYKGATSGAVQKLIKLEIDCDGDCVKFVVEQKAPGFCHNNTSSCFGTYKGFSSLEQVLLSRLENAPAGSYTKRLFEDEKLLTAKILEEAEELTDAKSKNEVAWEAADLFYFAMTKVVKEGVSWADVQRNLDSKSYKISRRKGDAKPKWIERLAEKEAPKQASKETPKPQPKPVLSGPIRMNKIDANKSSKEDIIKVLTRPVQKTADIMKLVNPIVENVRDNGDKALIELTSKFDKVELKSPILKAPFPEELMKLTPDVKDAIDLSIANVLKFHEAQIDRKGLEIETVPGVKCSRFSRPIKSVGLYIPGGTAVLPSTALMLGVPAKAAGCENIIFASPPRKDGTLTPEVVYVAHKVGAQAIVLAGGAQAIAAMAYGTESVPKVDKIMGPGNQFVTAAKMYVQNDTNALVSIDMPAGPSEVLVIADNTANPAFVASDLLSQAEHGVDSQVILLAVGLTGDELEAIEVEIEKQALALPRVDIVRGSIAHSTILSVATIDEAIDLSNQYAPEHLILQVKDASSLVPRIDHAGSVFVGAWSPESCGDYSSGTNHTLPTYGFARMYSGVNSQTFMKHITAQELSVEGLQAIGKAVMTLAAIEGLDAHRNAVKVRLDSLAEKQA
ncbi:hypothetical protein D0Z03_002723 [Geotrichum reessii]|nr:hypothetical protein D0Z03_002723 [Galactomyces reessii]